MKTIAKLLPIFLVLIPFGASAESAYDVKPQVKMEDGTGTSGSSGGSTGAAVHTSATVQVKPVSNIGSSGNDGVEIELHSSGSASGEVKDEMGDDNGTDAAMEIHGDPDFDLVVKSAKESDEHVSGADVDSDGAVEVEYEHQGHLFGFIPIMFNSKTRVVSDAGGMPVVKVSLPWWSFFVSDSSDIRTSVENELKGNAEVQANVSATSKVKLFEVMISSLAKVEASMKAGYDVAPQKKM